jgi:hypothetical protein
MDRGPDARGARTQSIVEQGLDQPRLRGVGGDGAYGVVRFARGWQEARLGQMEDDVPNQEAWKRL